MMLVECVDVAVELEETAWAAPRRVEGERRGGAEPARGTLAYGPAEETAGNFDYLDIPTFIRRGIDLSST